MPLVPRTTWAQHRHLGLPIVPPGTRFLGGPGGKKGDLIAPCPESGERAMDLGTIFYALFFFFGFMYEA